VLLLEGQRRELAVLTRGEAELLPLGAVIAGLGIAVHSDPAGGAVTLTYQGREASLYNKKSLASVGGDLRLLSSPALFDGGEWLIPVDGVPRILGPLLGKKADWLPASRVLLVGEVGVPRIGVTTFLSGDLVRVVLEASEKVPFRVTQGDGRVTVAILRDAVAVDFRQERLTGGIVDLVQFLGGRENTLAVTTGRRFQQLKYFEQDGPPRLVLEFQAQPMADRGPAEAPGTRPSGAAPPPQSPPPPGSPAEGRQRTIVIDPGHGGEEVGARGPGGTLEKDVTLGIAKRLRSALVGSLGYQVFLTRERDEEVPLDDRTAIANNYKADVFLSIHANASRSHGASGSEVYFLSYEASDEESRRVALSEGSAFPEASAPASSDLALILWDMAQAEHLEESSALALRLQEELARVAGGEGRGIKQAPFRVLVGAAMPAVLIEVAFISNPAEEKQLASDAFQGKVAQAILRALTRYENDQALRAESLTGAASAAQP
jgi:N-acetylmuramoyl-L-alanine amidase